MSAVAQQFLYATAPLSIAVLIEMGNRQRMQAQQARAAKRQLDDLNQLSASITTLTEHLQNIPSPEAIAVLEQAVGQQHSALDETVAYINTTYSALTNRLAEFEAQNTHRDISELKVAHGSIHTLLANLQVNLKQMTTRDQMEAGERAIAQVQQRIRHLDGQLSQLSEQTGTQLETLQAQIKGQQAKAASPKELNSKAPDFNEAKLDEIVNLMADLVPRRDWNAVMAQIQALQRQAKDQDERDQQLEGQIQALQQQLPNETEDSLAVLHNRWQRLLETVQDKIQALPDLAGLDTILQEMLQRRLQTFPEQALPHQLLVDLPSHTPSEQPRPWPREPLSPGQGNPLSDAAAALPLPAAEAEATTSRSALETALQTATHRVILTWPWAASYPLDSPLTSQIEAFLQGGKTLHLGWCTAYNRQEFHFLSAIRQTWGLDTGQMGRRAALQYLLQLKQRYPERLRIRLLEQGENFLVVDRQQAIIGIDPPLVPAADIQPLQLKVRTTSRSIIDSLTEQYRQSDRTVGHAERLWRQAMVQADLGDGAIARLDALLADIPESPETAQIYNMRGVLHYEQRRSEAAEADLTQAMARSPASGVPYCNRGVLRHRQGDTTRAIADFDQAMALMPGSLPLFYRGRCWETLERYQQAVDDYSRVLAAKPDMAVALWRRAIAYQFLGHIEQAHQDLHGAAWAFVQQNNSGAARRCLQQLQQWEQAESTVLTPSLATLQQQLAQEHLAS